jgi:hypothetical protein
MRTFAGIFVALALGAAGCGGESSSAAKYEGEERAIAETVEEMQTAGGRNDAAKLCRELIARGLREKIASGGTSCDKELEKAIRDADMFELDVREVTVSGRTARATVRGRTGNEKTTTKTFEFVMEDGRWRASSFGS